ncbi:hypothetical protein SmJEL517_g03463 [Synchytrium microbalum]|uniref:RecF/RecN/SMC N-terminal domain-containing protein n=1 Tax=Synchytrium microbalum TaxID=1806994 RepID=A0A507BWG6_9FUNG|nr:uncharacterized protein SmJEL517_g03463 [Synchytrium microbalum]TPX33700.1 hypothetical protein SmJEL517_g03463 [Synchytrium microbalum]
MFSRKAAKKRGRDEDDDDESQVLVPPTQEDQEEDTQMSEEPAEEDEEEDEPRPRKRVKSSSSANDSSNSGLRGVIKSVELFNFLTHEHHHIDLVPNINFITGKNGSGKSSILTAIVVGFGARASDTNRADTTTSFIRHGADSATIRISIYNEGDEAWQHDLFGDTIIVERKIFSGGSSRYRLLNAAKNTCVSEKKGDLDAMLDSFGILPDSPIMILNQDAAKKFLQKSTPQSKYALFHEGTLITKLQADLMHTESEIEALKNTTKNHERELEPLKRRFEELKQKMALFEQHEADEQRAQALLLEIAWAVVEDKEKDIETLRDQITQLERKVVRYQREVDAHVEEKAIHEATLHEHEQRVAELRAINEGISASYNQRRADEKTKHAEYNQVVVSRTEFNTEVDAKERNIAELTEKIDQVRARMADEQRSVIKNIEDDVVRKEADVVANDAQTAENNEVMGRLQAEITTTEASIRDLAQERRRFENDRNSCRRDIEQYKQQQQSRISAWGRRMPEVVAKIKDYASRGRWTGMTPIGPLGEYVKVRQEQWEYAKVIDNELGKQLSSFLVSTPRDMDLMKEVLRSLNMVQAAPVILINTRETHAFNPDRPPEQFITISREDVFKVLVVNAHMEQTILVPDYDSGKEVATRWPPHCGKILTAMNASVGNRQFGGVGIEHRQWDEHRPPRFSEDTEAAIAQAQNRLARIEDDMAEKDRDMQGLNATVTALKRRVRTLQESNGTLSNRKFALGREIRDLRERLTQYAVGDVSGYESEKLSEEESLQGLKAQLEPLDTQIAQLFGELQELRAALAQDKEQRRRNDAEIEKARNPMEATMRDIVNLEAAEVRTKEKLIAAKAAVADQQERLRVEQDDVDNAANMALDLCNSERIEPSASLAELQQESDDIEAKKKLREAQLGDPQELYRKCYEAESNFTKANLAVKANNRRVALYRHAVKLRKHLYEGLFRYYRSEFKDTFKNFAQRRGYVGRIKFHEDSKTMDVKMSKGNDQEGGGGAKRGVNQLSGGEKSYTTLCFLMALWELMNAPFYALDEFDVFMDSVNRQQSISLLTSAGKNMQLILISPSDGFTVPPGRANICKIVRLSDPIRGAAGGGDDAE